MKQVSFAQREYPVGGDFQLVALLAFGFALRSLQLVVLRGRTVGVFCGGKRFTVICAVWLFTVVGVVEPRVWRPSFAWFFAYYSGGKELN